jgi:hypothetical protein
VVNFWTFFTQGFEEKLVSSVDRLIRISREVALGLFVTMAPVIKRGMDLTDINNSEVRTYNYLLTDVATMQTMGIGNSSSFFSGPSVIHEENRAWYFCPYVPRLPVKKHSFTDEMMHG